jgi:hypothetical protein
MTPINVLPLILLSAVTLAVGCTPTLKVEAPDKPIEINMNIKIEQEVRVRVEKDLDQEIAANPDLFGLPSGTK